MAELVDQMVKLLKFRLCPELANISNERRDHDLLKMVALKLFSIAELAEMEPSGELINLRWMLRDDMQIAQDILMDQGLIDTPRLYFQQFGRETAYDTNKRNMRKMPNQLQDSEDWRNSF